MILVTLLGIETRDTDYALEGRTHRAPLAPLAIVALRGGFSEVVALCTPEAREASFPVLRGALPLDLGARCEEVPFAASDREIAPFLDRLTSVLDTAGGEFALDITHGPRHLQLLAFAAAVYLSALGRIRVRAAYYGLLRDRGPSPILELRPLLELVALAFAAGELRRTGSTAALLELLRETPSQESKALASQLEALAAACASGLPLEAGAEAARFGRGYKGRLARRLRRSRVPLADHLVEAVDAELARFALPRVHPLGRGWKAKLPLDREELVREGGLVDALLLRGAYGPAAIAAEEWVVSWALQADGGAARWLDRDARDRTARRLDALAAHALDPELRDGLTEDQVRLGRFWGDLKELRNSFAHAGMRREVIDPWRSKGKLGRILERVRNDWDWVKELPEVPLDVTGTVGRLLVTPVGRLPGAFHTALAHAATVDRCLCICSPDTAGLVAEVLERTSHRPRPDVIGLLLPDPYRDLEAARGLADQARAHLARAEEVVLNLTGGTTLMGLAVEWMGDEARRLGRRVRRLVVLDRRPREEQERQPYVLGEAVWLEGGGT